MKNSRAFLHRSSTLRHNFCEDGKQSTSCTFLLGTLLPCCFECSINTDQTDIRAFVLASCPVTLAMDPSQQQMHHRLARALKHLKRLASFFPFFQPNADWEAAPSSFSSANPISTFRRLHTFVPLPSSSSSASLATHGHFGVES